MAMACTSMCMVLTYTPWMPVYFIKPAGLLHMMDDLGYQNVMYIDWDIMLSPHTAPPLSLFYGEHPKASLLLQGEYNLAAGANLWRNTADGKTFLEAWWDLGAKGCCPTAQHDQSALKHIISAYLANITGDPSIYGPDAQQYFKVPASLPPPLSTDPASAERFAIRSTEAPPHPVSTWLRLRPLLQEKGSAIGLVGMDVHYPSPPSQATATIAFTSCMGQWWGCVQLDTWALLYHIGHPSMVNFEPAWVGHRMALFLLQWLSMYKNSR